MVEFPMNGWEMISQISEPIDVAIFIVLFMICFPFVYLFMTIVLNFER